MIEPERLAPPPAEIDPRYCSCPTPAADRRRNFGMCATCKRKPLALMAAR